jgi:predicted RNA-binding Zn-ribbon protein involved in translation (DUF1610 family)
MRTKEDLSEKVVFKCNACGWWEFGRRDAIMVCPNCGSAVEIVETARVVWRRKNA